MKEKNYELKVPEGYRLSKHIDARSKKFGIIFNLIALVIMFIAFALLMLPYALSGRWVEIFEVRRYEMMLAYGVLILGMIAYTVLHELTHGAAYKALTGRKLTFGMSWSCAFCGVPDVYVYRRAAMIAAAMPLAVFSAVFILLLIPLFILSPLYFSAVALLFSLHLGGCAGDGYVLILMTTRYKDSHTLVRDTGPEQFFYVPEKGED